MNTYLITRETGSGQIVKADYYRITGNYIHFWKDYSDAEEADELLHSYILTGVQAVEKQ